MTNLLRRIFNGPYPLSIYLLVTSLGAGVIAAGALGLEGWGLYGDFQTIPGATHISETFFSGILIAMVTGIVLHRHASRTGHCLTLLHHHRCPFLGIFILGFVLGGIATGLVVAIQGTGEITYENLMKAKIIQGFLTGFSLPLLFYMMGLHRDPGIQYG